MVQYSEARLDRLFHALSDPTRRHVLLRLRRGAASVSQLAEPLPMSMTAVAKHLRVLEHAGLVETTKNGRVRQCTMQSDSLSTAQSFIEHCRAQRESNLDARTDSVEKIGSDDRE